jgi:hypothetical protein
MIFLIENDPHANSCEYEMSFFPLFSFLPLESWTAFSLVEKQKKYERNEEMGSILRYLSRSLVFASLQNKRSVPFLGSCLHTGDCRNPDIH